VTVVAAAVTPAAVTPVAVAVTAGERPEPPYPTAMVLKRETEVGTEGETEVGP
jgi:hypothetical protein